MKHFHYILLLLLCPFWVQAQRIYNIPHYSGKIRIDGELDSSLFHLNLTNQFTTSLPSYGQAPAYDTEVSMCYTETGLYVFAQCNSGKIRHDYTGRDDIGLADYFSVGIDTWNDDQNAFVFTTTAAGQRIDQRQSSNHDGLKYDTPWLLKTRAHSDHWCAEMFIPYISLRFPTGQEKDWGLQFTRFDRTTGELSTWNPQNPLIEDVILQYGTLSGLKDIEQGFRMTVSPFLDLQYGSYYAATNSFSPATRDSSSETASIDVKIGLSSSTTLDFTTVPEYYYSEDATTFRPRGGELPMFRYQAPRQFQEEEHGMYNKTGTYTTYPVLNYDILRFNQHFTSLDLRSLNRTQFTTRTRKNLGVGVGHEVFQYTDRYGSTVDPPPSLNPTHTFVSIEKILPNNSWVHFSNGIYRFGNGNNSNLMTLSTQLRDKSNRHELKAGLDWQAQKGFSVTNFDLSLRRINSATIYGANLHTPNKTYNGVLLPLGFYKSSNDISHLGMYYGKRNFAPGRAFWQNSSAIAAINFYGKYNGALEQFMDIQATFEGLNRRFNHLKFEVICQPLGFRERLKDPEIALYNRIPFALASRSAITTDNRKLVILHLDYYNKIMLSQQRMEHSLEARVTAIATRFITIGVEGQGLYRNNQLESSSINSSANRLFEQYNFLEYRYALSARLLLGSKFNLYFERGNLYDTRQQRGLYELSPTGYMPVDHVFRYNPQDAKTRTNTIELNWIFSRSSTLKAGVQWSKNSFILQPTTIGGAEIPSSGNGSFAFVSIAYNLNVWIKGKVREPFFQSSR